jgi:hypothetical protein
VTFCESPELILEFFEDGGLDTLEVVVGDEQDYRVTVDR